ncbi:MAG: hypothetical protein V2I33_22800, partial [Kangiellaceae bacterium]|nr:hypothetical protein [Kangiellaceae bacterium]
EKARIHAHLISQRGRLFKIQRHYIADIVCTDVTLASYPIQKEVQETVDSDIGVCCDAIDNWGKRNPHI